MLPSQYNKKEPGYFCRFTFGQFFTLLVLEIFTLFFIFYLGSRYGGELLGIKQTVASKDQKKNLPEVVITDPNQIATTQDPEIKALAKDLLHSAPTPDLKARVAEMLEEPRTAPTLKAAPREEAVVAVPQDIPPAPMPPPPPSSLPVKPEPIIKTATTSARYSVQVGSYPNPDEAHTLVNYWKQKGYDAYLVSADIPDRGRWYRVRIGGFETKETAESYLKDLKSKEEVDAFISVNE